MYYEVAKNILDDLEDSKDVSIADATLGRVSKKYPN